MWELGLRHGSSSSCTIIIAQDLKDIPTDLISYNAFTYNKDGSDKLQLGEKIAGCIEKHLSDRAHVDSPFFDYITPFHARRREIAVEFYVDDKVVQRGEILIKKSKFSESSPNDTEETFFLEHTEWLRALSPSDRSVYDETEIAKYESELKKIASSWIEVNKQNYLARKVLALSVKLVPICLNNGDVPLEDVEINLVVDGNVKLFEVLPDQISSPSLPKKTKQKSRSGLIGSLPFSNMDRGLSLGGMAGMAGFDVRKLMNSIDRKTTGCHVVNERAWCKTDKIRQKASMKNWDGFFVVSTFENPIDIVVEIRAANIRGLVKRVMPIRNSD